MGGKHNNPRACLTGALMAAAAVSMGGCQPSTGTPARAPRAQRFGAIDADRIAHAAKEPGEWFRGGGDGSGAYYSHLTQINDANAQQLGFAWDYALHSNRGLEATPIVVDGSMDTAGNAERVLALDRGAATR